MVQIRTYAHTHIRKYAHNAQSNHSESLGIYSLRFSGCCHFTMPKQSCRHIGRTSLLVSIYNLFMTLFARITYEGFTSLTLIRVNTSLQGLACAVLFAIHTHTHMYTHTFMHTHAHNSTTTETAERKKSTNELRESPSRGNLPRSVAFLTR
jgi:hypothetical protein